MTSPTPSYGSAPLDSDVPFIPSHRPQPQRSPSDRPSSKEYTNLPTLAACYLGALTSGATTYAFSFYGNALKSSLRLSQNQLDTLSSATFCAGILGWIPGMAVDAWGARAAMAVGSTFNTVNLTLYWLIATRTWNVPSRETIVVLLSVLGAFIFMGIALVTGSVFKTIVEVCGPGTKGKAVGCAKGYVGLGSGVYVCLFGALSGGGSGGAGSLAKKAADPELRSLDFLLMAAVLSFLAGTLPAVCLLPKPGRSPLDGFATSPRRDRRDGSRPAHFHVIYAGLSLLGLWLVGTSLESLHETDTQHKMDARSLTNVAKRALSSPSSTGRHWVSAFSIILLWLGPILSLLIIPPRKPQDHLDELTEELLVFASEDEHGVSLLFEYDGDGRIIETLGDNNKEQEEEETLVQEDVGNFPSSSVRHSALKNGERGVRDRWDTDVERNYTLLQMLRTSSAWLMTWTYVILVGGGTVMTNNISQMTEALGFSTNLTPACLAFFSVAQCASRVITGIASEQAPKWNLPWCCDRSGGGGIPQPVFLVMASLVSAVSHFILAVSTSVEGFVIGVTLSGVSFGMVWPMMVLITGEAFGTRHVGANFMFFNGFSSAAGTLLLSKYLVQTVYDGNTVVHPRDTGRASPTATDDEDNFKCFGPNCFRATHTIISLLSLTCIVSSMGLMLATRDLYQRQRHLRDQQERSLLLGRV